MHSFLIIASLLTLLAMLFTPLPMLIASKAVSTFSYKKVQFYTAAIAFTCLFTLSFASFAYAQDPSSEGGLIQYVLEHFMEAKKAGSIALALLISKVILFAFNTPKLGSLLDKLTGKMKLLVTLLFTYIVGVLTIAVMQHVSIPVALFDSANIPLLGLLLNQIYKQFIVKASEPPKLS